MSASGSISAADKAEGLILVLHGVGANPSSLSPLAGTLAKAFPTCAVRAPPAPDPFLRGHGRQWFSIDGVTATNRPERIAAALSALERIVDTELSAVGHRRDRLALVGFSQGAMMALALAASGYPPASIVAVAGRLAVKRISRCAAPSDVLLLHGSLDPVVPLSCAYHAATELEASGRPVRLQVESGLAHAVSPTQIEATVNHLARTFSRAKQELSA